MQQEGQKVCLRLLKTLTNHISALALMELTKHCWEQHGHSTDQKKNHLQAYLRGSKSIQPLSGQGFFPLFVSALIPLLMTKSSLISRELGKTEQKKN